MSIPLMAPSSHDKFGVNRSLAMPSSSFDLFSSYNRGCALTILRGDAEQPISPHSPIYKKATSSATSSPARPRFAGSFAKPPPASKPAETSLNVHAVSDQGILLPFLDRPSEVYELLFQTKTNEPLMHRLCRIFGGDIQSPTKKGIDERWDEMLQLLTDTDRPILDDEDWLIHIESLVIERSPELWAQLSRCLGADGLTCSGPKQSSHSRFDSWAPSRRRVSFDRDNQSSLLTHHASDEDNTQDDPDLEVNVEALENVPAAFAKQPSKMQQSSLHEGITSASQYEKNGPLSPSQLSNGVFPMSFGDGASSASLANIMEEPGKSVNSAQAPVTRKRSQSGRFAALRISAMASTSPPSSRRSSDMSSSRPASANKDRSVSPMHADATSMTDAQLGSALDATEGPTAPASFSRHRRLSTMIVHCQAEPEKQASDSGANSPRTSMTRRLQGMSETDQPVSPSSSPAPKAGRRRAQSFARSFAGLNPGQTSLDAEATKYEADKGIPPKALSSRDPAVEPTDKDTSSSALITESRTRRDSTSSGSSSSSPILGLLPDGRTRHPSGSYGSKDLSESVAAFRATMGLSTSPSYEAPNLEGKDDSSPGSGTDGATTRKRKGTGAERPRFRSLTDNAESKVSADAKVSRVQSPDSNRQQTPSKKPLQHVQKLDTKQLGAGKGSGLALGGGFSLAKSGANFRRQSHDATPTESLGSRVNSDQFSFHSPPLVRRRPGGFASLANEYDFARRSRRATNESVFSMNSNAIGSSPSSSIASPILASGFRRSSSDGSPEPVSATEETRPSTHDLGVPAIAARGPKQSGGVTPRASFGGSSMQDEYLSPGANARDQSGTASSFGASGSRTRDSGVTKFLNSTQAGFSSEPTGNSLFGPRSPTIVFPISSNPAISRARELQKALDSDTCQEALVQVSKVCDSDDVQVIRDLIGNTERSHMSDEALLEAVGQKLGLVDHERAHKIGGTEAERADIVLAEEGYDERWQAFASLCRALGVGQYELSAAKRRCGPAIDLSGH